MSIRIARGRVRLALALSTTMLMLLGTAAPASADFWPGYTPCSDGDFLQVSSFASGSVYHSVDGQFAGAWFNGQYTHYNVGGATAINGYWSVDTSFGGWISSAWATCIATDPPPDDPPDDDPPDDGGGSEPGYCEPGGPPLPPGTQCP